MVMLATSYVVENDIEFAAAIKKASDQVSDLRLAFTLIARDWIKSNMAQFSLKSSGQYPPLSPAYAASKLRKHGKRPILVATGRLRDSIASPSGRQSDDGIKKISKTELILGTKVPYGIYHQSDAPRSKIPLRKFLFIGPEAPKSAPHDIRAGRMKRWLGYLEAETARKLRK